MSNSTVYLDKIYSKDGNTEIVDTVNRSVKAKTIELGGNIIASHSGVEGAGTVTLQNVTLGDSAVSSRSLSFRNLIINGNLGRPINQRGAASLTASTGYNYDRWYYDGSTYLYQGIEDKNVNNGTYVISWEGAGINAAWKVSTDTTANNGPDATTGFTSVSNGGTFTVNEGTEYSKHLWIRFDGTLANLDKVQVEAGTVATPFEHRPISVELSLCQRYFEICGRHHTGGTYGSTFGTSGGIRLNLCGTFKVTKRATPTCTSVGTISYILFGSASATGSNQTFFDVSTSGVSSEITITSDISGRTGTLNTNNIWANSEL